MGSKAAAAFRSLMTSAECSVEDLDPGDHIFSWRNGGLYAHHGIFIGEGRVIHFTNTLADEIGLERLADWSTMGGSSTATAAGPAAAANLLPCLDCGEYSSSSGVVRTCMDCFLSGGGLCRFEYGVSRATLCLRVRMGTCTTANADDPVTTLCRAVSLLEHPHAFGPYHVLDNNCETFAVYCKTGLLVRDHTKVGTSGQAASAFAVPLAMFAAVPFGGLVGLSVVAMSSYALSKLAVDLGIRTDTERVEVDDLIAMA